MQENLFARYADELDALTGEVARKARRLDGDCYCHTGFRVFRYMHEWTDPPNWVAEGDDAVSSDTTEVLDCFAPR